MFDVIVLTIIVVSIIYYLTGLPFELGTGFTEEKNKARKGDYSTIDKKDSQNEVSEIKFLE